MFKLFSSKQGNTSAHEIYKILLHWYPNRIDRPCSTGPLRNWVFQYLVELAGNITTPLTWQNCQQNQQNKLDPRCMAEPGTTGSKEIPGVNLSVKKYSDPWPSRHPLYMPLPSTGQLVVWKAMHFTLHSFCLNTFFMYICERNFSFIIHFFIMISGNMCYLVLGWHLYNSAFPTSSQFILFMN